MFTYSRNIRPLSEDLEVRALPTASGALVFVVIYVVSFSENELGEILQEVSSQIAEQGIQ